MTSSPARCRPHVLPLVGALLLSGLLLGACGDDTPQQAGSPSPLTVQPGSVTRLAVPAPEGQRCLPTSSEFLDAQADVAVDARVEEVSGGEVVLVPSHWYRGDPTEILTLTGPPAALAGLLPGVEFTVGQRYLVAGSGGTTMICGFSGPWSSALERLYTGAFGR
ncbi:hypothetical protein [Nocardioides sp.]|uniref:hypothetical protein n=1 Tax=Nocardioides sp. TaxID=35761 RepID=UPI0027337B9A|nr:hypothetical protein [Nocardioides sp.]MDP3891276.1 hypothetical protein [Nocardioides sp.]